MAIIHEWLKAIFGDSYTEDMDKKVSVEIGKQFVSKENYDKLNTEKKDTDKLHKEELTKRDTQLEDLKKLGDPTKLQEQINNLTTANAKDKADHEAALKKIQLDTALDARLTKEGAVNTKAVRTLLDMSKISLDNDNLLGVDDQVKTLKEKEKWAFGAPAAGQGQQSSTGMAQQDPPPAGGTVGDAIKSQIFGTSSAAK